MTEEYNPEGPELDDILNDCLWQMLQNQGAILVRLKNTPVNQGKLFEAMDQSAIEKCIERTGVLMNKLEDLDKGKP